MFKSLLDAIFKSYKTTLGGALALAAALLFASSEYFEASGDNFELGALLLALGASISGFFGRDAKAIGE